MMYLFVNQSLSECKSIIWYVLSEVSLLCNRSGAIQILELESTPGLLCNLMCSDVIYVVCIHIILCVLTRPPSRWFTSWGTPRTCACHPTSTPGCISSSTTRVTSLTTAAPSCPGEVTPLDSPGCVTRRCLSGTTLSFRSLKSYQTGSTKPPFS